MSLSTFRFREPLVGEKRTELERGHHLEVVFRLKGMTEHTVIVLSAS